MDWLDFDIESSKVEVTVRLSVVKNHFIKMRLSGEGVPVDSLPLKVV